MPRPGPRPYECVRRAWHSDRHQPMRGSLIQEMFRVVSEAHSPATRRNREWQEKLPCVVLRAEEIMYSKANSEAEYMDPKTLWDRANDAIDTIIRRDDHESPDLLHPCIEAALNLGCIPRRASRSQRHSNPGCYLSSNAARNVSREIPDHSKSHHGLSASALAPIPPSTNLQSATSLIGSWYRDSHSSPAMNSGCREFVSVLATSAGSELNGSSTSSISELPLRFQNAFLSRQHTDLLTPVETCIWPSNGCVYPLYYRDREPKTGTRQLIEMAQGSNYTKATSTSSSMEPIGEVQVDFLHDFLGSNLTTDMLRATSNVDEPCTYPSSIGCDLSLSLAPSGMVTESTLLHRIEDMGSSSSCQDKSYRLLPKDKTVDPLESCSSK